jgi:hypothetical protein
MVRTWRRIERRMERRRMVTTSSRRSRRRSLMGLNPQEEEEEDNKLHPDRRHLLGAGMVECDHRFDDRE